MVPGPDDARPARSTRARPTDDELLDGAVEVFARDGVATTMSAVAEHCNSTKPTLYAHFGDKDALHLRVLEREADTCRATLFTAYAASAGLDLRGQVEADTRALFEYADAHPSGFALLFGGDTSLGAVRVRERLLAEVEDHLARRVHDYLRDRGATSAEQPSGVEQQVAAMLAGVAVSAARHALQHDGPYDRACDLAVAFSVAALSNLDPTGDAEDRDPVAASVQAWLEKPVLRGSLVELRPPRRDDAYPIARLLRDTELLRLTASVTTTAEARAFSDSPDARLLDWYGSRARQPDRLDLVVVDLSSGEVVGEVVLNAWDPRARRANFRTFVGAAGRGRGLGTEAARLLLAHAFDRLGLHRIELTVLADNPRALHVYEKLGFVREGVRRDARQFDDTYVDEVVMALLEREWRAAPRR